MSGVVLVQVSAAFDARLPGECRPQYRFVRLFQGVVHGIGSRVSYRGFHEHFKRKETLMLDILQNAVNVVFDTLQTLANYPFQLSSEAGLSSK